MDNISDAIFSRADSLRPAVIADGLSYSFGEIDNRRRAVAALIREASIATPQGACPRIALSCPNGVDHITTALGILSAGACMVPVPDELSAPEKKALLERTGAHAIISRSPLAWEDSFENEMFGEEGATHFLSRLTPGADLGFSEQRLAELNPALIRFSSGTTGESKGIVISHAGLLERITAANRALGIDPADRVLWMLPMAHHFAVSIILYLYHGAVTVLCDSHMGDDVLTAGIDSKATVIYGAPYHYNLLAEEPSGRAWPSLRLAVSTAAALSEETASRFVGRYGLPLHQGMGIIEVGLPLLNTESPAEKPTSVGRPLSGFECRLSPEGELELKGPGMLEAYLSPWRERSEICDNEGWFATGDLARIDECGDVFLIGRTRSVINIAGLKCFPEEVERVLNSHPDITESYVHGYPHRQVGSVPIAQIVMRPHADPPRRPQLAKYCRARLAAYKVPLKFEVVDRLEKTPSGKIRRV